MSACDEFRSNAAGIASLPESDPERQAFLRHAAKCPDCTQAFQSGAKLMRLIEARPLPPPSAEVLRKVSAQVTAQLQPAQAVKPARLAAEVTPARWLAAGAAAVGGFFVPVLLARRYDLQGLLASVLVLIAAAIFAASASALRAGALVVVAASAGFAFAAGGVPGVPQAADLATGELYCVGVELVAAALPLAAAAWASRRTLRPGMLAQAAAAGALAGQAALHLSCGGRHDAVHLWLFHFTGVVLAALAGFVVERQLISARS